MTTTAVIPMLHEDPAVNSATRLFRQEPVLAWALDRIGRARHVDHIAIICWEDQRQAVQPLAAEQGAHVLCKSPRTGITQIECISAARRWSDGWRGGLLGTCDFDLGFYGPYVKETLDELSSDQALLIDPAAGMVDFEILDRIIEHARSKSEPELIFTQAAPGLAGALLRNSLVERLAATRQHPGILLSYLPGQPIRDPIAGDGCVTVPPAIARTNQCFKLDSKRQVRRLTEASVSLNGQLISTDAEQLLGHVRAHDEVGQFPRDLTLELTTRRSSRAIFQPSTHLSLNRPDLPIEIARTLFAALSDCDDLRLTLAGAGDPLLHRNLAQIVQDAHDSGIRAIHVETDLLCEPTLAASLVGLPVDVVSVHIPALTASTYNSVMGVDGMTRVLENIKAMVVERQRLGRGTPILAPLFTKCAVNLHEMEGWYDQWLGALGAAVIVGPSDFAGQIPSVAVTDMSPPKRSACRRIQSRMTVLSDGSVPSCEMDVAGVSPLGNITGQSVESIWQKGFSPVRQMHQSGRWSESAICRGCRDWHRP